VWEDIYDLNRATIGDNPARLKVGMILKLPAAPTATASR
jgi:nucleoid-associated protein YgaU